VLVTAQAPSSRFLPVQSSLLHTVHAHMHARAHTRMHARAHTHIHCCRYTAAPAQMRLKAHCRPHGAIRRPQLSTPILCVPWRRGAVSFAFLRYVWCRKPRFALFRMYAKAGICHVYLCICICACESCMCASKCACGGGRSRKEQRITGSETTDRAGGFDELSKSDELSKTACDTAACCK